MKKICFWPALDIPDPAHPGRISGHEVILNRIFQSLHNRAEILGVTDQPAFTYLEEPIPQLESADVAVAMNFNSGVNLLLYRWRHNFNKPCFFEFNNNPLGFWAVRVLAVLMALSRKRDFWVTGTSCVGQLYRKLNSRINIYDSILAGIDMPEFSAQEKEPGCLVYVGRVAPDKDNLSILLVLEKLKKMNYKFKFHVLGDIDPGKNFEYYQVLRTFIAGSILKDDVFFHGIVSDKERTEWLDRADIFISFSTNRGEIFGLTPLEAMSHGVIPVLSGWDGYRETIFNREYLIPVNHLPAAGKNIYAVDIPQAVRVLARLLDRAEVEKDLLRAGCRSQAANFTSEKLIGNFMSAAKLADGQPDAPLFNLDDLLIGDLNQVIRAEIFPLIFPKDLLKTKVRELLDGREVFQKYLNLGATAAEQIFLEDFLLKSFYS